MQIVFSPKFEADLKNIIEFYFEKNPQVADNFYNGLSAKIRDIAFMPYRFRKNQKLNKEDIREMIFKGYVIPFRIADDHIKILSIFKHNLPNFTE